MEMGVEVGRGFLLSACCCIHLCLPVAYSKQPKALIACENNQAVLITNICVQKIARRLERNVGKHAGGQCNLSREVLWGTDQRDLLP